MMSPHEKNARETFGRHSSGVERDDPLSLDDLSARIAATAGRLTDTVTELKAEVAPAALAKKATTKVTSKVDEVIRDESGAIKPVVIAGAVAVIVLTASVIVWKVTRRS